MKRYILGLLILSMCACAMKPSEREATEKIKRELESRQILGGTFHVQYEVKVLGISMEGKTAIVRAETIPILIDDNGSIHRGDPMRQVQGYYFRKFDTGWELEAY